MVVDLVEDVRYSKIGISFKCGAVDRKLGIGRNSHVGIHPINSGILCDPRADYIGYSLDSGQLVDEIGGSVCIRSDVVGVEAIVVISLIEHFYHGLGS